MSDAKAPAYDWRDDPEHIVSVHLGGDVVRLEIADPFLLMERMSAYGRDVGLTTMHDLFACVWPADVEMPDKLFPAYKMGDLQIALARLTERAAGLFPSQDEVQERAAHFPD